MIADSIHEDRKIRLVIVGDSRRTPRHRTKDTVACRVLTVSYDIFPEKRSEGSGKISGVRTATSDSRTEMNFICRCVSKVNYPRKIIAHSLKNPEDLMWSVENIVRDRNCRHKTDKKKTLSNGEN